MSKVELKVVVHVEMSLKEAVALEDALRALPDGHPTDELCYGLRDALQSIPESLREGE